MVAARQRRARLFASLIDDRVPLMQKIQAIALAQIAARLPGPDAQMPFTASPITFLRFMVAAFGTPIPAYSNYVLMTP
jgi:hypothetical protein